MKLENSAINLLVALGGACMNMTFGGVVRRSVDRMTEGKPRKAAGTYGRDLKTKFDTLRHADRIAAKTLAYANKR